MPHAPSAATASIDPPRRTGRWLMLTCAGLIALTIGAAVLAIWDARREALARYQQTETNLGFVLAEQTARSIQGVDLVLQAFRTQVLSSGVTTPAQFAAALGNQATGRRLRDRLSNLPQARCDQRGRRRGEGGGLYQRACRSRRSMCRTANSSAGFATTWPMSPSSAGRCKAG